NCAATCNYEYLTSESYIWTGTSMACPAAAGCAALVRQYFTEGWYPNGAKTPSDAFTPSAALIKAMLINGALDMSGESSWPTDNQGFGRVELEDVLYFSGDSRVLNIVDETSGFVNSGQADTHYFQVGNSEPLEITLVWTDHEAAEYADPAIINDLDLRVEFGGNIYRGNVFSGRQSTTGGSYDRLNVEEEVLLKTPPAAECTVIVYAYNISYSPQPYALVVTGDLPCNHPPDAPTLIKLFDNERMNSTTPTLEWNVPVDDDGENLHFRVQWDDNPDFSSPTIIESKDDATGFSCSPPVAEGTGTCAYTINSQSEGALTDGITYYWRVSAWDGLAYGSWSETRSFTVNTAQAESDWFQTMDGQFETDSLWEVMTSSNSLILQTIAASVETLKRDDGGYEAYDGTGYANNDYTTRVPAPSAPCTLIAAMIWVRNSPARECTLWLLPDSLKAPNVHIPKKPASAWVEKIITPDDDTWTSVNFSEAEKYYLDTPQEIHVVLYTETSNTKVVLDQTSDFDDANGDYYSKNNDPHENWDWTYTWESSLFLFRAIVKYPESSSDIGKVYSTPIAFADNPGSPTSWDKVLWTENDGDSIRVTIEYRSGGSWNDVADTATIISGTNGQLDISGFGTEDTIRAVAILYRKGGSSPTLKDWAVTWAFGPPNNPPVVSNVSDGVGWHRGNITITYDLADDDGDNCTVTCEWYDGTWHSTGNVSGDGIGTPTPPGTGKTITWQSALDFTGESSTIQFRITPNDGSDDGTPGTDNDCDVDNKAPDISATGSGVSGSWGCYTISDITLYGTDGGSGFESGCPRYSWTSAPGNCSQGSGYTDGNNPSSIPSGTRTLYLYGEDAVGNISDTNYTVRQDCDPPTQPGTPSTTSPTCDDTPTWTWDASTDALSGMPATNAYQVFWSTTPGGEDNSDWTDSPSYTHSVPLSSPDTWYFKVVAYDNAGNSSNSDNGSVDILEVPDAISFDTPNKTTTSLTWNWFASSGATSYDVDYDAGGWTNIGDVLTYQETGLGVNTQHCLNVRGVNTSCTGPESGDNCMFTYAIVPDAPICSVAGEFSIFVDVQPNGNPADVEYAIYCVEAGQYVQTDGSLAGSEAWQTDASWGNITVTGLNCATTYNFRVKARNGDNEETAFGPDCTSNTAACGNQPPNAPTLYNTGGSGQLVFDNARLTDDDAGTAGIQLIFRMSTDDPDSPPDDVQYSIQINSESDWTGTDIYNGDLAGIHTSGNIVDKVLTCSVEPTDGETYYVRVRAIDPYGSQNYGSWSSYTWSFTYKSSGDAEWYQTEDEQFNTGILTDTETDGFGRVYLGEGAATATYDYDGVTQASGPHDAFYCDVDAMPPTGNNLNSKTEANDAQYGWIASSNDIRWDTPNPGRRDEVFLWCDIYNISEAIADITQIDFVFEGYPEGGGNVQIWAYNYSTDTWGQIGTAMTFGTSDATMTRSITSNFGEYIDGTGKLVWGVYGKPGNVSGGFPLHIDYVKVDINYQSSVTSGTIASPVIDYDSYYGATDWNQLLFTDDETNGDIKYTIQYWDGASWQNTSIVDEDNSPVDISALDPTTHDSIRIVATLTKGSDTPYLEDWTITWQQFAVGVELLVGNSSGPEYTEWALGNIDPATVRIMDGTDRVYVKNIGSEAINIIINASPIAWEYSDHIGADTCLIMALFNGTTVPVEADFS
ncbi:hypothetical protein DRQ33_04785, partial [bacterium]